MTQPVQPGDDGKPHFGQPGSFTDIAFDSGRIYERNRIIKQLADARCDDLNFESGEDCYCGSYTGAIAIIKGDGDDRME